MYFPKSQNVFVLLFLRQSLACVALCCPLETRGDMSHLLTLLLVYYPISNKQKKKPKTKILKNWTKNDKTVTSLPLGTKRNMVFAVFPLVFFSNTIFTKGTKNGTNQINDTARSFHNLSRPLLGGTDRLS